MKFIANLLGGSALSGINDILGRFVGNKDLKETNIHDEQISLRNSVTAEFARAPVTWWDSLVDGLNRLVRPMYTFGTLSLFVWAVIDPIYFSASMQAISLIPDSLWYIMLTIVFFWFGSRTIEVKNKAKSISEIKDTISSIKEIQSIPEQNKMEDEEYDQAMKSTDVLSNDAILEWNKRRGNL